MTKVALITGTRKGIGHHLAQHLLQQGWKVAGVSRREAGIDHENYRHYLADVTDEKAVVEMVRQVKKDLGPIDALLNNAGTASMNHVLLTPVSTYRSVFDTNVLGSFLLLRECAKLMIRNKCGRIINFSSIAVPLNLEGEAIYAASKAAIESLTRTTAKELAPHGVTVNAIGPTPVKTDLVKFVPQESMERLIARQPLPRFGNFEDISNCIDFFLKEESAFITGQTLYLGGVS